MGKLTVKVNIYLFCVLAMPVGAWYGCDEDSSDDDDASDDEAKSDEQLHIQTSCTTKRLTSDDLNTLPKLYRRFRGLERLADFRFVNDSACPHRLPEELANWLANLKLYEDHVRSLIFLRCVHGVMSMLIVRTNKHWCPLCPRPLQPSLKEKDVLPPSLRKRLSSNRQCRLDLKPRCAKYSISRHRLHHVPH